MKDKAFVIYDAFRGGWALGSEITETHTTTRSDRPEMRALHSTPASVALNASDDRSLNASDDRSTVPSSVFIFDKGSAEQLDVSVNVTDVYFSVTVRPNLVERQARAERINRAIELGYMPPTNPTSISK